MEEDIVRKMGIRTLATRFKRISDKISHSTREMYRSLEMDIEPNWYLVLYLLQKHRSLSAMEIGAYLGFTHQSVLTMTSIMIKRGYLSSEKDTNDARRTLFSITEKSEKIIPVLKEIWDIGEQIIQEAIEHDEELLSYLDRIEDHFNQQTFGNRILEKFNKKQQNENS